MAPLKKMTTLIPVTEQSENTGLVYPLSVIGRGRPKGRSSP